jgi:hypothetical protein
MSWGGDNLGTGSESVLIDLKEFRERYPLATNPLATSIVVDLRAYWNGSVGVSPVSLNATLWKGGTPEKNGCNPIPSGFSCWTNPTSTQPPFIINSVGRQITSRSSTCGQRVATLTYNLETGVGAFNNDDNNTPSLC